MPILRAALLFAIKTRRSIDVGLIIQESISYAIRAATSGGLVCPSLITALCSRAGVVWSPDEELQHPLAILDDKVFTRLKGWTEASSGAGQSSSTIPPVDPAPLEGAPTLHEEVNREQELQGML